MSWALLHPRLSTVFGLLPRNYLDSAGDITQMLEALTRT